MWPCKNGRDCITPTSVCDGKANTIYDCFDGSDELPETCSNWECPETTWRCNNNMTCLPLDKVSRQKKTFLGLNLKNPHFLGDFQTLKCRGSPSLWRFFHAMGTGPDKG